MRDIQRLMKMAASPDPEAALEHERAETRERVAQIRKNTTYVRRILIELSNLDLDQKRAVVAQLQKEISDAEASVGARITPPLSTASRPLTIAAE
jgi:hypothetical protein